MPGLIPAGNSRIPKANLELYQYDYSYPYGLDLDPHSDFHNELRSALLVRATEAQTAISARYDSWDKIEQSLTCYIPTDVYEKTVQNKDSRKPVSIVVPMTFVNMETILTYLMATFLQNPLYKYEPIGPEDELGTICLEILNEQQSNSLKHGLAIHTMCRDALVYGFGMVNLRWHVEQGYGFKREQISSLFPMLGSRKRRTKVTINEGTVLDNIDPFNYFPDPNVPIHEPQKGEYLGWLEFTNRMALLSEEQTGGFFNCKYLAHITGKSALNRNNRTDGNYTLQRQDQTSLSTAPVEVLWLMVRLIPNEWKLGSSEYPERWLFGLAGDQVIIHASKMDYNHNRFPVAACAPDTDGRAISPISRCELDYGLQKVLDFLFNTRIKDLRQSVGSGFIYDPSVINELDILKDQDPPRWRLRKANWGKKISDSIMPIPANDTTRSNISDAYVVMDMTQRVTGATDALQGIPRRGSERRTATEMSETSTNAKSRVQRLARQIAMQAHLDIARMCAFNTQQFLDRDVYAKVAGRWEEKLRADYGGKIAGNRLMVGPDDLEINFDVIPHDATISGMENAAAWTRLAEVSLQNPANLQFLQLDAARIFKHAARQLGAVNIDEFSIKVAPPQPVGMPEAVQSGNGVPIGNMMEILGGGMNGGMP